MKHLAILASAYVAFVLQSSVANQMAIRGYSPEFVWLALVGIVLYVNGWTGVAWAGFVGFVFDCISPDRLGINLIWASLVALALQLILKNHNRRSLFQTIAFVFPAVLLLSIGSTSLRLVVSAGNMPTATVMTQAAGNSLYSTILALFLLVNLKTALLWIGYLFPITFRRFLNHAGTMS